MRSENFQSKNHNMFGSKVSLGLFVTLTQSAIPCPCTRPGIGNRRVGRTVAMSWNSNM